MGDSIDAGRRRVAYRDDRTRGRFRWSRRSGRVRRVRSTGGCGPASSRSWRRPACGRAERYAARLEDGLEQNLSLVLVKSVLGLMTEDGAAVPAAPTNGGGDGAARRILEVGARFGARQRAAGWGPGLTILTAMGNVL